MSENASDVRQAPEGYARRSAVRGGWYLAHETAQIEANAQISAEVVIGAREHGPVAVVTEADLRDLRRAAIEGVLLGLRWIVVIAAVIVLILHGRG